MFPIQLCEYSCGTLYEYVHFNSYMVANRIGSKAR